MLDYTRDWHKSKVLLALQYPIFPFNAMPYGDLSLGVPRVVALVETVLLVLEPEIEQWSAASDVKKTS